MQSTNQCIYEMPKRMKEERIPQQVKRNRFVVDRQKGGKAKL